MKKPFSRYVDDALDDEYRELPPNAATLSQNDLPQEEWEVRKYLEDFYMGRIQLSKINIFSMVFNFRKYSKLASYCNFQEDQLIELIEKSPMHKAAMRRVLSEKSPMAHVRFRFDKYLNDREFKA